MKIRRVWVQLFERQLNGKAWNPAFRWTNRRAPLLIIELDNGVKGVGEAWSRYTDADTVLQTLSHEVAPALRGRHIDHPSEVWSQCLEDGQVASRWDSAAAWSAADMALWDAFARNRSEPLWKTLGGQRPQAPSYASGGLYRDDYGLEDLHNEARSYRQRGFTAMKMKIAGVSLEIDLQRVAAVREGLGSEARLWVDAVNQLTAEQAVGVWQDLQPFGVSALQSPLPAENLDGLRYLRGQGVSVIASEGEFRHNEFARLLNKGAVSHLQYCLTLCGGFTGGAQLDTLAAEHGITSTPQCFSTAIAQAATLHFAAARSNVIAAEFHCFHDHLQDLYLEGASHIQDGTASAGEGLGLSVDIPEVGVQKEGSVIRSIAQA